MKCKKCGTENAPNRIHCVECGARLNTSNQNEFDILDIIDEDSDAFDDESISDMERRFTGGLGSWKSFSKGNTEDINSDGIILDDNIGSGRGNRYSKEMKDNRRNDSGGRTDRRGGTTDSRIDDRTNIYYGMAEIVRKKTSEASGISEQDVDRSATRRVDISTEKDAGSSVDRAKYVHVDRKPMGRISDEANIKQRSNVNADDDEALSRRFVVYRDKSASTAQGRSRISSDERKAIGSYTQKQTSDRRNIPGYAGKTSNAGRTYPSGERRAKNIDSPRANNRVGQDVGKGKKYAERNNKPSRNDDVNHENTVRSKEDSTRKRNIFSIAVAFVTFLILILVFVVTLPGANNASRYTAEITRSEDRADSYHITVNAGLGDTAVFKTTSGEVRELEITSKRYVTFNVLISDLLPHEPIDTPTYTVEPIVGVIRKGETEVIKANITPISVDVPQFAVAFDHETELEKILSGEVQTPEPGATPEQKQYPIDADTIACSMGSVTISGRLPEIDITVTIDGEPIKLEGNTFSYTAKFESAGEHQLQFVASSPGYLTVKRTFKAIVDTDLTPEQVICIDDSFNTRVTNETDEITVVGTIPAGAQIRVESNDPQFSLKADPSVDSNGNFSFTVNLPIASKNYEMNIIATTKSGSEIVRPFAVQRPPVFNEYVPTVWACSYNDMIKPMYYGTKGFQIVGYITELLSSGDCQRARMQLSTNQTIILNYYNHYAGSSTLEANKNYTMYGYPIGLNADGELEVFIWFVRA